MYPAKELKELAGRKTLLQGRIALRRLECSLSAHQVARPVRWLDQGVACWRGLSPGVKTLAVTATAGLLRLVWRRRGTTKGSWLRQVLPLAANLLGARFLARRGGAGL